MLCVAGARFLRPSEGDKAWDQPALKAGLRFREAPERPFASHSQILKREINSLRKPFSFAALNTHLPRSRR